MDLGEEKLHGGIKEIHVKEGELMTMLPKYIRPCKAIAKFPNDPDNEKFMVSTPLLLEKVVFEGTLLTHISTLKMEYWDLGDHEKFPQLEPTKYISKVYYKETKVTRLEPMKWVASVGAMKLLNML